MATLNYLITTPVPSFSMVTNISTNISMTPDPDNYPGGDPNEETLHRMAMWIIKLVFPTLVMVGTFGNIMVLVVLKRGAIRTDNLVFFLSALAVVDTVFLYSSCFKTWLRVVADFELLHVGTWSCKLILFLSHLSLSLSAWLMVIITWQRWYTCAQPFQRCCPTDSSWCGYLGLAGLLLVLLGANSYVLFTAQLYKEDWGYLCAPSTEIDKTIGEFFPIIMVILYSGAPAVLLFVLNGLLVHVLYRSKRALLTNNNASRTTGREEEVRTRYNHVTVMLVALSACWFVFAMPQTILKQIERYPKSAQETAFNMFLNVLVFVLLYLNHTINFFVYCTLMRSFRREVKRIIKQVSSYLTSAVPDNCSTTRRDSLTDIAVGNNHHHNHHNHHHHHNCQHSVRHNSQGDSNRPLIVKFNKAGHGDAYTRRGKS